MSTPQLVQSSSFPQWGGVEQPPECRRLWYAAYTMPRHEKFAAKHIADREVELFLPLHRPRRKRGTHCRETELPLFPGYLFTRIGPEERTKVLTVPGVVRLVGFGGNATPIEDAEIDGLRALLAAHDAVPTAYKAKGDRVRIFEGPFAGLQGTVIRTKAGARIVVSVDLLMRSVEVEVDDDQLELMLGRSVAK